MDKKINTLGHITMYLVLWFAMIAVCIYGGYNVPLWLIFSPFIIIGLFFIFGFILTIGYIRFYLKRWFEIDKHKYLN